MKSILEFDEVFLHRSPVDGRKQLNGLTGIIEGGMKLNAFTKGALFVFTNRAFDTVKVVYWNRTGFALWMTKLEKERFRWPLSNSVDVVTLEPRELEMLLEGYDIMRVRPHQTLSYSSVY